MWELDCEEGWALNNWCFWTVVLEKTLESPLECKEIQPDQSWVFIGRTDIEAETPILWPLMQRTDSLEKTLMLGKIQARRRRGWQGWHGWMASPTQWAWVWVDSGSWWWTGRPGVLWFTGLQRVRHYWETELTELIVLQNCSGRELWRILRWVKVYNDLEVFRYDIMKLFSSSES